jgi:hypothetical protein
MRLRALTFTGLSSGISMLTFASAALGAQAVFLTGVNHNLGEKLSQQMDAPYTIDDICREAPRLGPELKMMVDHMDHAAAQAGSPVTLSSIQAIPGAPSRFEIEQDVANATREFCNSRETGGSFEPFVISYTSCRMSMLTPTSTMVINITGGGQQAHLFAVDHAKNEAVAVNLSVEVNAATDYVGSGWAQSINMEPQGMREEHLGYEVEFYKYTVNSGLGDSGPGGIDDIRDMTSAKSFGSMVSVTTKGSVWAARNAPGDDVVRSFYENLTTSIQLSETSMFAGLIKNMAGTLQYGMPLITETEMTSKIMGREMAVGKMRSYVTGIRVRELTWSECAELAVPEDYQLTDLNEEMSEAMGGADTSEEMAAAMQEYQQAMEGMTPEQQQMLESMGIGSVMGGGAPGAQPPNASPRAATGSAGSNMPSSDELQGGSVTESVQKHLQALGYDVGEVNGEMSMETTIAISTFQAEKGMKVTGEVSPQLLGILSAEVDSRR